MHNNDPLSGWKSWTCQDKPIAALLVHKQDASYRSTFQPYQRSRKLRASQHLIWSSAYFLFNSIPCRTSFRLLNLSPFHEFVQPVLSMGTRVPSSTGLANCCVDIHTNQSTHPSPAFRATPNSNLSLLYGGSNSKRTAAFQSNRVMMALSIWVHCFCDTQKKRTRNCINDRVQTRVS